jgi:signal transduction histidine kinase
MNQTLRETIWLLDHETITVEAFGARLHNMLLKVWDDRELPVLRWTFQNTPENLVLPPLVALHLVRITQEATNNALKYAGATEIVVTLAVQGRKLSLTVQDNGKGFDAANADPGFGISNLRKRTEEVKGDFQLETGPTGTYIKVILPLNT